MPRFTNIFEVLVSSGGPAAWGVVEEKNKHTSRQFVYAGQFFFAETPFHHDGLRATSRPEGIVGNPRPIHPVV